MPNPEFDSIGNKIWTNKKGQLHRTDGPAVVDLYGTEFWYKNGKNHRTDGPAVVYKDGSKTWYKDGKFHRINGPAVTYKDGTERWYKNGIRIEPIPSYILLWKGKLNG